MRFKNPYLEELIKEVKSVSEEVVKTYGSLSTVQLNWKPDASQWSIGQCVHHLITTNQLYFKVFRELNTGNRKPTFWERIPILPDILGKMVLRSVQPQNTKKVKTFKIFLPTTSNIDLEIISTFENQQLEFIQLLENSDQLNHGRIVVSSPVFSLVTFRLQDCCNMLIAHEKRHVLQAKRVLFSDQFPNS